MTTKTKKAPIRNGRFIIADSGDRTRFATGAVRDSAAGKGAFHLIPYIARLALAQLYESGALKYGRDNWKKGIPLSRYIDAIDRHSGKTAECWTDEDHPAAVMWNAACFIWTVDAIQRGQLPRSLDDIGYLAALEALDQQAATATKGKKGKNKCR